MLPKIGIAMGAGYSTSFSPSQLSGLTMWFKADSGVYSDAGTTLATNGQTVQQWNDQSASAGHATQGTAGARPTYQTGQVNGLPALSFDGTADFMDTGANVVQRHVFIVAKNNGSPNLAGLFNSPTTVDVSIRLNGTATEYIGTLGTTNSGDWTDNNTSTFLVNGANVTTLPAGFHVVEGSKSAATGVQNISISGTILGTRFWKGWIAELIMYSGELSVTDATRVRNYLANKYAIAL